MKGKSKSKFVWFCALYIAILQLALTSNAIVLHNDDQPQNHPLNSLIGRWSTNASCVVINPNLVLTVKHSNKGVGEIVTIGGVAYAASQIINLNSVDLKVIRITDSQGQPPNLSDYANRVTQETQSGNIVLGGYGRGRGADLQTSGQTYGYQWLVESNTNLRWATNEIITATDLNTNYGETRILVADFDDLDINLSKRDQAMASSTDFEGILAEYDSGGGWFINDSGNWYLVAISAYLAISRDESWFINDVTLNLDPDEFYGIEISTYNSQIDTIINWMQSGKIISGYITDLQNNPLSSVYINASNTAGQSITDANGYYELWVPTDWSGTVTPSKTEYSFEPSNRSYTNISTDAPGENYILANYKIAGQFFDSRSQPFENVIVDANNGGAYTTTDANGNYSLMVPHGWTGTVTPAKTGYEFTPEQYNFQSLVTSDVNGFDFDTSDVNFVSDDFNDNLTSANWILTSDIDLKINEADQALNFYTVNTASENLAVCKSNEWNIDTSSGFSLKVELHNSITEPNEVSAIFKIIKDVNNYAQIKIDTNSTGDFYNMTIAASSVITHHTGAIDSNDNTLSIFYDQPYDNLYLSIGDYGDMTDGLVVGNISNTDWFDSGISVELAVQCNLCDINQSQIYFDNFTVNTASVNNWPPRTDIDNDGFITFDDFIILTNNWLSTAIDNPADIDQNQIVDFNDLARFAQTW